MFQPRFADAAGSRVRQGEKIDIVDISGFALISGMDMDFALLPPRLAGWPSRRSHKDAVNTFLRICNLRGHRFAAIVLRRNIPLGEMINVGAEGNTAASRGGRRLFLIVSFPCNPRGRRQRVYWYGVQGPRPAHAARAARATGRAGERRHRRPAGRADLSDRARHRAGVVHRRHSFRRSTASCRRCCSPKASTSRRATCWRRSTRACSRPRSTRPRPRRPRTRPSSRSAEKDLARSKTLVLAEHRHRSRSSTSSKAKVDQLKASIAADEAAIADRADPARLHHHHRAERRPHRRAPGRSRQHRARHPTRRSLATLVLTRPSAVLFTLPARSLDDVRDAMARGPVRGDRLRPGQPPRARAPASSC